jgi:hypothetical protein
MYNCMCIHWCVLCTLVRMMVHRNRALYKSSNFETWHGIRGLFFTYFNFIACRDGSLHWFSVSCRHGACGYVTDWWCLGDVWNLNKSIVAHHFNNRVTKSLALRLQNGYLVEAPWKGVTAPGFPGATSRSTLAYLNMIRSILQCNKGSNRWKFRVSNVAEHEIGTSVIKYFQDGLKWLYLTRFLSRRCVFYCR